MGDAEAGAEAESAPRAPSVASTIPSPSRPQEQEVLSAARFDDGGDLEPGVQP